MDKEPSRIKERSLTLDCFKGLAILGVVFTHTVWIAISPQATGNPVPDGCATIGSVLGSFMLSALMIFFVVSGYLYKPQRSVKENIVRRVKQLLIPFLVLTFVLPSIVFCCLVATGKNPDIEQFLQFIGASYISQFFCADQFGFDLLLENQFYAVLRPFYYFLVLTIGFVVFYNIAKYCTENWKRLVGTIFALLLITGIFYQYEMRFPFFIELVPLAVSFMLVGAFLKKHDFVKYIDENWRSVNFLILAFGFFAIGVITFWIAPAGTLYLFKLGNDGVLSAYTFFIGMLSSGMFILMFASLLAKIPYLKILFSFTGQCSLEIFAFHMFYVKLIASFFLPLSEEMYPEILFDSVGEATILMIVSVILSILTALVLKEISKRISESRLRTDSASC